MRAPARCFWINAEIMDDFLNQDLSGVIHFGLPDDYACAWLLPAILSTFQKTHPQDRHRCKLRLLPQELLEGMVAWPLRPHRLHAGHQP